MTNIFMLLMILMLVVAFLIAIFCLMTRTKGIILWGCGGFVAIGFLIYTAGYLSAGVGIGGAILATLRGIVSTARMFAFNEDFDQLASLPGTEWLTQSIGMQILFWLAHVSAVIIIQVALLSLFGKRLMDEFRLRFGWHREVFVIYGGDKSRKSPLDDKNALMLGENIVTHDNPKRRPSSQRLVVFLVNEDDQVRAITEKARHFGGIVKVLDRNHDLMYHLKKMGLGKSENNRTSVNVIFMSNCMSAADDSYRIVEFAKENNVEPERLELYGFVSTEWGREKIEKITQDKEGKNRKYPYTIHIVNELEIISRKLIEKHPPFKCPGLNLSDGKASRNFNVMILGFSDVGQSVFLRLMMNGQFVGSKMQAIIVDKEMDNLFSCFQYRIPALAHSCKVEPRNFDVQCDEFYKLLKQNKELDYVVIALGDDDLNKQMARDIVRHYEQEETLVHPYIAVYEENGGLHRDSVEDKVFTFGCREEIYKESVILREEVDRMGKVVHQVYDSAMDEKTPWHKLEWFYQESSRAAASYIPTMLHLAGLTEEDALTADSLANESDLKEVLARTEKLRWDAFHVAMGYRRMSIQLMNQRYEMSKNFKRPKDIERPEISGNPENPEKPGTSKGSKGCLEFARKDSKARLHACLVVWDELDEVSKAYRKLAQEAGDIREQSRDFKDNDRKIVENIPRFLRAAREMKG